MKEEKKKKRKLQNVNWKNYAYNPLKVYNLFVIVIINKIGLQIYY